MDKDTKKMIIKLTNDVHNRIDNIKETCIKDELNNLAHIEHKRDLVIQQLNLIVSIIENHHNNL